jgi:anti-sigma factor RsiW
MSCEEIENQILDYQDNQLSPARRQDVETHLAGCAGCRTFARQLSQLVATLSARVKVPALSLEFDPRLQARIQAAPTPLPEAQRAERKRQLQAEFEAGRVQINRQSFALGSLGKHLTWPVLAILSGWLAWRVTLLAHVSAQSLRGLNPNLLPLLIASAVFLTVCHAKAFPQQRKLLRFW